MKTFKPLYIANPDYTDIPHTKTKRFDKRLGKTRTSLSFHSSADETQLVVDVEEAILKQCRWLTNWLYENGEAIAKLRPIGSPADKINGTMLMLAISRVARAKVRRDWVEYSSAILQLNSYYIYALELRYNRPCGYTDPMVVIGSNRNGWRKQPFNPEGKFVSPDNRPFGRYQVSDK